MKTDCNVIRDLLPLFFRGVCHQLAITGYEGAQGLVELSNVVRLFRKDLDAKLTNCNVYEVAIDLITGRNSLMVNIDLGEMLLRDWALDGEYAELILNQFSVGGCDVFARHGDGELLRAYNAELSYAILDLCPCATDGIPLDVTYSIDDIFLSFFNMITTGTWVAASDTLSFFDSGISADMSNEKFEAEDIMFLSNIVAKLSSENFEIFKGEIKNNNGEIEIKDGHIPTQKEIAEMDFFVQGITGTLK